MNTSTKESRERRNWLSDASVYTPGTWLEQARYRISWPVLALANSRRLTGVITGRPRDYVYGPGWRAHAWRLSLSLRVQASLFSFGYWLRGE